MARFTLPRDLYHGPHALEALKTLPGKRAMICVGGGSMKRFGFLDRAEAYLKEAGMEVELFEGIEPDPSVETVMKGAAAMEKVPARLDRRHRRRLPHRRRQGHVDQVRVPRHHL